MLPRPAARASLPLVIALLAGNAAARAQQPSPAEAAEALMREERIRATVEVALDSYLEAVDDPRERIQRLVDGARAIVEAGPEAAPYLVNEAEQGLYNTFYFASYALGLLGTDEAREGLLETVRRAESEEGSFAASRKGWAGWCLALAGDPEAAAIVNRGTLLGGLEPIYRDVTALEAIGLLTGADAVPALVEQNTRFDGSEEVEVVSARRAVVLALGRTGAAAARDPLLATLKDEIGVIRREAARALGWLPADEKTDAALAAALADADPSVRHAAAMALAVRLASARLDDVSARLAIETNPIVRGRLYRAVAALAPDRALALLAEHAWRGDPTDRLELVRALSTLDDPARVGLLAQAAGDPDTRVAALGALALADVPGADAAQRLARIGAAAPEAVADEIIVRLAAHHDARAVDLIRARIVAGDLAGTVSSGRDRDRILRGLEPLVELGATSLIEPLRQAAGRQADARLVEGLEDLVARLEAIRGRGDDVAAWVEATNAESRSLRGVAYRQLARIGGPDAAAALAARVERTDGEELVAVIDALGSLDQPAGREALRRVLLDPAYLGWRHAGARDAAAWAARRIGGDAMAALLGDAIEHRRGDDAYAFFALAQLDPEAAADAYARLRLVRLRAANFDRGSELAELDRLAATIAAGRAPSAWDLPPGRIDLR